MPNLKALSLIGLFILSACGTGTAEPKDIYQENGNTINVSDRNELYNENVRNGNDSNTHFGYVRQQRTEDMSYRNNSFTPQIDREEVADAISKLTIQLPNVQDAATLVTDEEVLVVYQTDSKDRFETADQVKKTALSVVPRYFHVYVSDDPNMVRQIERFGRLDTNTRNIEKMMEQTIQDMKKSPQGRKLRNGENANGEEPGEEAK